MQTRTSEAKEGLGAHLKVTDLKQTLPNMSDTVQTLGSPRQSCAWEVRPPNGKEEPEETHHTTVGS
jgi:hypothetical protein